MDEDDYDDPIEESGDPGYARNWYAFIFGSWFVVGILMLTYSWRAEHPINSGVVILASLVLYIAVSFRSIGPQFQGVVTLFGKPVAEKGPGLVFAPRGIANLITLPQTEIQYELQSPPKVREGADINKEKPYADVPVIQIIGKGEDGQEGVVIRMNEPFRVTFANRETGLNSMLEEYAKELLGKENPSLAEKEAVKGALKEFLETTSAKFPADDPLNQSITTDPKVIVRIHVHDAMRFVQRIGGMETAGRYIRSTVMSTLQTMAARYTVAMALYKKTDFEKELKERIEELIVDPNSPAYNDPDPDKREKNRMRAWAVDLLGAQIETFGLSYGVNLSMSENTQAGFEKKRNITLSEGEKQRRINYGEGDARALQARGFVEADVIRRKRQEVEVSPVGMRILELENQAEVAEKVRTVVITPPGNGGDLLGGLVGGGVGLAEYAKMEGLFTDKHETGGKPVKKETSQETQAEAPAPPRQEPRDRPRMRRRRNPPQSQP